MGCLCDSDGNLLLHRRPQSQLGVPGLSKATSERFDELDAPQVADRLEVVP